MSDYLEYFDFDAFPSSDEYTFDFGALDNLPLVGEEGQNPASNAGLLLPDVTAPIAELEDPLARKPYSTSSSQPEKYTSAEVPKLAGAGKPTEPLSSQYDRQAASLEKRHTLKEPTAESHQHDQDIPDHRQIKGSVPFSCAECLVSFTLSSELESHVYRSKHRAYACSCGKSFARIDSLLRHKRPFQKNRRLFPCTFCKRHRGEDGFRRRDHLTQHLHGYHKFSYDKIENILPLERIGAFGYQCMEPTCEFHRREVSERFLWMKRPRESPFQRRAEYNKHLKEAHNATPYPCPISECTQVGAKGYTTWNGLEKHLALKHETSPESLGLENWNAERRCDQCQKALPNLEDFNIHHQLLHQS